jgi:hypothetical protein
MRGRLWRAEPGFRFAPSGLPAGPIAATALAQYLLKREHGMEKIRDMIVDDIRQAQQRQDKPHILTLLHVLHHFLKSHPEVCPPQHPWSQLY